MSLAAASPVPRPPGSSRAAASRWCCTKCGRFARPPRTRPDNSPNWSAPIRSAPTTPRRSAIGLLHAEMRRLGSLVMRAADRHKLPAGGALAVDRDGFAAAITAALEAEPLIAIDREEIVVAAGGLGQRHRRHRPAHLAAARRDDPQLHRRRRAGVLRCHCADRASRLDRLRHRLVSVALRQGRTRRLRRRLHQLPADARTIRRLHRRAARRRQNRVPRIRNSDALFRRLPADRSDGRARPRDAAPRPDEAVRPHQSASARRSSPMPSCNCARTTSSARLFNMVGFQTKLKHAEQVRIFRTIPGLDQGRVRPARRPAPQHLPQFAETARRDAAAQGHAAAALCRTDHRLRGLCRVGGDRPPRRPLRRSRTARRAPFCCRRRPPRTARCSATSPAAISRLSMPGRARFSR